MTEEQKQAARERLAKARAAKQAKQTSPETNQINPAPEPSQAPGNDPDVAELTKMVLELKEQLQSQSELNKAFLAGQASAGGNNAQPGVQVGSQGKLIGIRDKYSLDFSKYDDPRDKLKHEPRLERIAFDFNYVLDWKVDTWTYDTKEGYQQREPKFELSLSRILQDENGEDTGRRARVATLVFFEDPQTAVVVAQQNGLPIDQENEQQFLNAMRYLRMRDWLYECFWPAPVKNSGALGEEVIGGRLVQVWTKSSEEASPIPFDKMDPRKRLEV
jgi:hypothetical protein